MPRSPYDRTFMMERSSLDEYPDEQTEVHDSHTMLLKRGKPQLRAHNALATTRGQYSGYNHRPTRRGLTNPRENLEADPLHLSTPHTYDESNSEGNYKISRQAGTASCYARNSPMLRPRSFDQPLYSVSDDSAQTRSGQSSSKTTSTSSANSSGKKGSERDHAKRKTDKSELAAGLSAVGSLSNKAKSSHKTGSERDHVKRKPHKSELAAGLNAVGYLPKEQAETSTKTDSPGVTDEEKMRVHKKLQGLSSDRERRKAVNRGGWQVER
ncbi:hypothetical protein HD806DRAFT_541678 [Xylariaceae sp. AK1471]|nr:hypothetical protein HD806DRAFT_541678 [Xylariaceae sp. AK1471]